MDDCVLWTETFRRRMGDCYVHCIFSRRLDDGVVWTVFFANDWVTVGMILCYGLLIDANE